MHSKNVVGADGEAMAAAYLEAEGHVIVDKNWRCRYGEIDLVTRDQHEIVFVEVKTRTTGWAGHPLEAVTPTKLARLRRLAGAWIAAHPHHARRIRIDAIGIIAPPGRRAHLQHVRAIGA